MIKLRLTNCSSDWQRISAVRSLITHSLTGSFTPARKSGVQYNSLVVVLMRSLVPASWKVGMASVPVKPHWKRNSALTLRYDRSLKVLYEQLRKRPACIWEWTNFSSRLMFAASTIVIVVAFVGTTTSFSITAWVAVWVCITDGSVPSCSFSNLSIITACCCNIRSAVEADIEWSGNDADNDLDSCDDENKYIENAYRWVGGSLLIESMSSTWRVHSNSESPVWSKAGDNAVALAGRSLSRWPLVKESSLCSSPTIVVPEPVLGIRSWPWRAHELGFWSWNSFSIAGSLKKWANRNFKWQYDIENRTHTAKEPRGGGSLFSCEALEMILLSRGLLKILRKIEILASGLRWHYGGDVFAGDGVENCHFFLLDIPAVPQLRWNLCWSLQWPRHLDVCGREKFIMLSKSACIWHGIG